MDHVNDEPGFNNHFKRQDKKTMLHLCHSPHVSMHGPGPPETPGNTAETSDDHRVNTAEPVPRSSSSLGMATGVRSASSGTW